MRELGEPFWLDVDSSDSRQHALLADVFAFHPLAIEDTLNRRTRVKVEDYDGYIFVVLRAMQIGDGDTLDTHALDISKLCIFLAANYVVSVHADASSIIDKASSRVSGNDPGRVAHAISDVVIDEYFPILDRVDNFVDRLERSNLSDIDRSSFRDILQVRRLAFATRRSLRPQQAIFDALAHHPPALLSRDAQLYFRDVYDHAERIAESLEAYHELMGTTTDAYIAQLSTRLDYATTVFSAIATLTIPVLVISSLFGMNFADIPFARSPHGFWIAVGLQIIISVAVFVVLRRRRLI